MNRSFLAAFSMVGAGATGLAGCDHGETFMGSVGGFDPPVHQNVTVSDVRPPPLTGGTLLVNRAGSRAIVSDPDRDRIVVVDLDEDVVLKEIPVSTGGMPGRAVEDEKGRVHVVVRDEGILLAIDPIEGVVLGERKVCAAPRGIAVAVPDKGDAALHVACAGGELVTLGTDPAGAILGSKRIADDLRDVVVTGSPAELTLLVSTFRSAEVYRVDANGEVTGLTKPRTHHSDSFPNLSEMAPTVGWRLVPTSDGAVMIHQRSAAVPVDLLPGDENEEGGGEYGGTFGGCGTTIVESALTGFLPNGEVRNLDSGGLGGMLLPIDVTVDSSELGDAVAFVSAGGDTVGIHNSLDSALNEEACETGTSAMMTQIGPEPIAVEFARNGSNVRSLYVQLREPSTLVELDPDTLAWRSHVVLGGPRREDTGHTMFHRNPDAPTSLACASCHPEGRDDGHIWSFLGDEAASAVLSVRRTQSLAGGIMDTAPFHWKGDLGNMHDLMSTIFEGRMGGFEQTDERVGVLEGWIDTIPRVRQEAVDETAAKRGQAIFERADVGCSGCHSGSTFTDNRTVDVGTGEAFQTPSLRGVGSRGPFMHNGCAPTLHERFDPKCGGGDLHGRTSMLSSEQIDDLVTFMKSL